MSFQLQPVEKEKVGDTAVTSPTHNKQQFAKDQTPILQMQSQYGNRIVQQLIQRRQNKRQHTIPKSNAANSDQQKYTGLPANLKSAIESLSGYPLDDVKVHYNSNKPAQLNAHAYTQGTDIHIAPKQEKHLPHEAWHVVQQKQGRVKPATQAKRSATMFGKLLAINNDAALEREADVMGAKAAQMNCCDQAPPNLTLRTPMALQQKNMSSPSYTIQLAKVSTLQNGKLNVVGEHHGESDVRRDAERLLAQNNQLDYKLEYEARSINKELFALQNADITYGDPPWLRAISMTKFLVDELRAFATTAIAWDPDNQLIPLFPSTLGYTAKMLTQRLNMMFLERDHTWWPDRAEHYRNELHKDRSINNGAFESAFYVAEMSHKFATNLIAVLNNRVGNQELTPPVPMTMVTGKALPNFSANTHNDPSWNAALEKITFTSAASFQLTAHSFYSVSEKRSADMHAWAKANANKPILWKVGDSHIEDIIKNHETEANYAFMTKADFDKLI